MKLALSVDCGGSLTRMLYRLVTPSKEVVLDSGYFSPLIEEITQEKLDDYFELKGWAGITTPDKEAYINVGEKVYVLGDFAKEFDPEDRIFEKKYEYALYKVLAAIGIVFQKNQLKQKKAVSVYVSVLLPWDEYNDRRRFKENLVRLLSNFQFRGQTIKVKATTDTIVVRPEGGGIAAGYILKKGADFFKDKNIGVAMFGHRNLTALYFEDGRLIRGSSPKLGFTWLLDRIIETTSGLSREQLLFAISKVVRQLEGSERTDKLYEISEENYYSNGQKTYYAKSVFPQWKDYKEIQSLATARAPEIRDMEITDLCNSIDRASSEYREKVRKWWKKVFPSETTDYLLYSGGSIDFFREDLEDYCNCYPLGSPYYYEKKSCYLVARKEYGIPPSILSSSTPYIRIESDYFLCEAVSQVFKIKYEEDLDKRLLTRFADNYGIFEYLLEKQKQHEAQQRQVKKADSKSVVVGTSNND